MVKYAKFVVIDKIALLLVSRQFMKYLMYQWVEYTRELIWKKVIDLINATNKPTRNMPTKPVR